MCLGRSTILFSSRLRVYTRLTLADESGWRMTYSPGWRLSGTTVVSRFSVINSLAHGLGGNWTSSSGRMTRSLANNDSHIRSPKRGASSFLRDRDDSFHVFVYAPWDEKISRVRLSGKSKAEAVAPGLRDRSRTRDLHPKIPRQGMAVATPVSPHVQLQGG